MNKLGMLNNLNSFYLNPKEKSIQLDNSFAMTNGNSFRDASFNSSINDLNNTNNLFNQLQVLDINNNPIPFQIASANNTINVNNNANSQQQQELVKKILEKKRLREQQQQQIKLINGHLSPAHPPTDQIQKQLANSERHPQQRISKEYILSQLRAQQKQYELQKQQQIQMEQHELLKQQLQQEILKKQKQEMQLKQQQQDILVKQQLQQQQELLRMQQQQQQILEANLMSSKTLIGDLVQPSEANTLNGKQICLFCQL